MPEPQKYDLPDLIVSPVDPKAAQKTAAAGVSGTKPDAEEAQARGYGADVEGFRRAYDFKCMG